MRDFLKKLKFYYFIIDNYKPMDRLIKLPSNSWIYQLDPIPSEIKLGEKEFGEVWNLHPVEFATVNVYGEKKTPRWQQAFGRDYSFSKTDHKASPLTHPYLLRLMDWSSAHCREKLSFDATYNSCLINWYEDGNHYIGPHSDGETDLVPNSPIYSFSFGQERTFRVTKRENQKFDFETLDIEMKNNSLLVMGGEMQKHFKHAVPKRSANKCPGRRINVTFRQFK